MKFQQNEKIANKLMKTKGKKLIEGNSWHDNYWGDCNCNKCANIEGENVLGRLLMIVRSELLIKRKI